MSHNELMRCAFGRKLLVILVCLFVGLSGMILGQTYNGFRYTVSGTRVTITGYEGNDSAISIPSSLPGVGTVTAIDGFSCRTNLNSVTIPNSVTSIGDNAFYSSNLNAINVAPNNSSYSSQNGVLFNKSRSDLIRCPRGFKGTYTIPTGVTSIGDYAFYWCDSLTSVTIPNSVTSIGGGAFGQCFGVTNVTIPNSVTFIGYGAFSECNFVSVTIPNSVTFIGAYAFGGCFCLTSISLPNSVTNINYDTFLSCERLTNVIIPNSVTSIGAEAFYNCTSLTSAYFRGNAPSVFNGTTFNGSSFGNTAPGFTIYYPATASGWSTPYWNGYPAKPYTDEKALLSIGNLTVSPQSVYQKQNVSAKYRIYKWPRSASSHGKVRFRLTTARLLQNQDPQPTPYEVDVPSFNTSDAYDCTTSLTIPTNVAPGTYYLSAFLVPHQAFTNTLIGNSLAFSDVKVTVVGNGSPVLSVSPQNATLTTEANYKAFTVSNVGGGVLSWKATITDASWIRFAGNAQATSGSGVGRGSLMVCYDSNTSTTPRTAHILVSNVNNPQASQAIIVTQNGAPSLVPVTAFTFSKITSAQTVAAPFHMDINAVTQNGSFPQIQTALNGMVELKALNGANVTPRYVYFLNGTWGGDISLDTPSAQMAIIARNTVYPYIESQSDLFTVKGKDAANITVTILLKSESKQPIFYASVSMYEKGELVQTQISDLLGKTTFKVNGAGTYEIIVTKPGYSNEPQTIQCMGSSVAQTIILPEYDPRQPVILVHGILGSHSSTTYMGIYPVLGKYPVEQSELKFHDLLIPDIVSYPLLISAIYNPVLLITSLRMKNAVGWDKLERELNNNGFNVYRAAYDWRMPSIEADSSGNLAWKKYLLPVIQRAKKKANCSKVHIVAHSMGGLVTRAYIQSDEYQNDIAKLAMVGTPNLGAADAYYLWFGGNGVGKAI